MKQGANLIRFSTAMVRGVVLLIFGVGLTGCSSYTWNQKMTIEVGVDGQVYAGSSVVQVRWRKNDPIGAANGPQWLSSIRGEAPFVEIPEHGVLFGLLGFPGNTSYMADLATRVLSGRTGWTRGKEEFSSVQNVEGEMLAVRELHYPLLVTFTDINDPKTVKQVDPDNLEATFGPGVSLKRITLEITDEPVTEGKIERVLGWFFEVDSLTPREEQPRLVKDQTPEQKVSLFDFMDWKTFREKRKQLNK